MSTIRPVEFPTLDRLQPDQTPRPDRTKSKPKTKAAEAAGGDAQKQIKKALNEQAVKFYQPANGTVKKPAVLGQNIDIKV